MSTTSSLRRPTPSTPTTEPAAAGSQVRQYWMAVRDDGRGWLLVVFGPDTRGSAPRALHAVPEPAPEPTPLRRSREDPPYPGIAALTPREREVLELLAGGATNGAIGSRLYISPRTASVHVSRILAKLGATTRTEAAALAYAAGLEPVAATARATGQATADSSGATNCALYRRA